MICALCLSDTDLVESHILPAFVFRWLQETGGPIRQANNMNKRVQDGTKLRLLCRTCETKFSQFENHFASKLFTPMTRKELPQLNYEQWLLKYCVSISWRILVFVGRTDGFSKLSPENQVATNRALDTWRAFLMDERPHPGVYEQHLFPAGPIVRTDAPHVPANINRYLTRSVEMDVLFSKGIVMTFAKMGPVVVLGVICMPKFPWQGTKVHVRDGRFPAQKAFLPKFINDHFFAQARKALRYGDKLSERQKEKIAKFAAEANIEQFSGPLRALELDRELFEYLNSSQIEER